MALRIGVGVLAAVLLIAWDQPTATTVFVVAIIALLILAVFEIVGRGGRASPPASTEPGPSASSTEVGIARGGSPDGRDLR